MTESSFSRRRTKPAKRATNGRAPNGDKRTRILEAAVAVFARGGFHATRVADVARAAGVADGTIYLYFESKEALVLAVFEQRIGRMLDTIAQERERDAPAAEKLRRVIELQLGLLDGEKELAEVLTVILRQSTKLMKSAAGRFVDYLDGLASLVAEGQRSGEFRSDLSPHLVARSIFGALDGVTFTWAFGKAERGHLERAGAQAAELVLRGLAPLPGDAAPAPRAARPAPR